jgi:hypothetical protein
MASRINPNASSAIASSSRNGIAGRLIEIRRDEGRDRPRNEQQRVIEDERSEPAHPAIV